MSDEQMYIYNGNVSQSLFSDALEAFRTYKADKLSLINRIKDNERYYRDSYSHFFGELDKKLTCNSSFIFSSIENARADAIENYPTPNILERDPDGSNSADVLSKVIPAQLDISDFKSVYKENVRNKLKYGTAIYGVFYNEITSNIEIKSIDILDVFVDMHIPDIQSSPFLFISAAIENKILREKYPDFQFLFTGDATIETLTDDYSLKDMTVVLDCYYKKTDGSLHLMKICKNTIIEATEDTEGYEHGLYNHSMYPVVFDVLYPIEHCPFGFGMIDIGKPTQIAIDKLDHSIIENTIINSKPRFFVKKNSGLDEKQFLDWSKNIVYYEGDGDSIKPISASVINEYYLNHRIEKKDELKELLANRDFQQGSTSGGVTAASAIQTLQEAGEKRSRSIIDDTYDSYKKIVLMMIELMRQFYSDTRYYRTTDEFGKKDFASFDNSQLFSYAQKTEIDDDGFTHYVDYYRPLQFDIDVVAQRENPYSQEKMNNTILTFWSSGFLVPDNIPLALIALKNMNFDGKEKFISDLKGYYDEYVSNQKSIINNQSKNQVLNQTHSNAYTDNQSGFNADDEELIAVQLPFN